MKPKLVDTFEKLYQAESDSIFRFCLIRVSNREQALDITQETFLRLWQTMQNGEKILNYRAFIFTITRRLIIDWYRKKKSLSLDSMISDNVEFDTLTEVVVDDLQLKAEGRYLVDQISKLSDTSRDPVYLRFIEDLSPKEIGIILGISTNAASVRINRGLLELRKKTRYDSDINDTKK